MTLLYLFKSNKDNGSVTKFICCKPADYSTGKLRNKVVPYWNGKHTNNKFTAKPVSFPFCLHKIVK